MIVLFSIISVAYLVLIVWLIWGVFQLPKHALKTEQETHKFSILIPFRNEEKHLFELLKSLSKINYPKDFFEILLVNDDSNDNSLKEIERFNQDNSTLSLRIIDNKRQTNSPKKDAINTAISIAKYNWIITTDADCLVPEFWLQTFNSFILENKPVFIAAAVVYKEQKGFLHQFQQLDWNSLTAMTMGSFGHNNPMLASGANLCYSKEKFIKIDGFKGNDHIASGDDVFLVNKMEKHFPSQVLFLNSIKAIVTTFGVSTWSKLINQRIRWASKTGNVPNRKLQLIGGVVFLMNLSLVILVFLSIFNSSMATPTALLINVFFIKILIDSVLIYKTTKNLNYNMNFSYWFWSSLLYPFFSVWVAFRSLFSKYEWKGRKFSK